MHWFHSELQTIICTDLSLLALSTHFSCLTTSLALRLSSSAFSLSCSSSLLALHCLKLLKIQVTLLNNLPRKSFSSLHSIAHYGLRNHIPQPDLQLPPPSPLPPHLSPICSTTFTEMSRNCLCKTFIHCASILWKQIYFPNSIRKWNTYTHLDPHH